MIVYAGVTSGATLGDVWALSLSGEPAWRRLDAAGSAPDARYGHSAIYDPRAERMLVFAGVASWNSFLHDVWALSLDGPETWHNVDAAGNAPPGRYEHSAIYDPLGNRMVVFGGGVLVTFPEGSRLDRFDDTWTLSLTGSPTWDNPQPPGTNPPARSNHSAVYDPMSRRMLVFGGAQSLNDVWALTLAGPLAWHDAIPAPPSPSVSYLLPAVYDALRGRLISVGIPDAWSLPLADPSGWSRIPAVGIQSGGDRRQHSAIYDPLRDRVLIYGGRNPNAMIPNNDVMALSLGGTPEWTTLHPTGQPPGPRSEHTAVYDPVRDRMLIMGGIAGEFGCGRNDVWALSLSDIPTWVELHPQGMPPAARIDATAVYDPVRDRVVLFGGQCASDLWALWLAGTPRWEALSPAGPSPGEHFWHSAIYDSRRDRMVVFGGYPGVNDVWALSFSGALAWSRLQPVGSLPGGRYGHGAIYDSAHDRMVILGGANLPDAWSLAWSDESGHGCDDSRALSRSVPLGDTHGPWLGAATPDPMRETTGIRFRLSQGGHVSLIFYDAAGRRVRRVESAEWQAGEYSVRWDGRDDFGQRVRAGLYFYRLEIKGETLCRTVVVVP